ncbi:MAG: hypothetical protein ACI97A_002669 [Planctomycetota bacterium]|jgi:hypothetical protein
MKNVCFLAAVILTFSACSEKKTELSNSSASKGSIEEALPTLEEEAALQELAKPVKNIPKPGSLEGFFVDTVKDLMLNSTASFDKKGTILRILDDLDALGLTPQGRPEGLVRDIVTRMMEDTDSFRPPNFTAKKLDDMGEEMLVRLGKSYLTDLRDILNPEGKDHKGSVRRVTEADPAKVKDGYQAITWKTIGGFRFDEKVPLPQAVRDLDGKKVALVGFMYPSKEYEDIHEFLLVESMWTCCFGEPPQVTQVVKTNLDPEAPGLWVITTPIIVHGTFHVEIEKDEGWIIGVYRISADSVEKY